MIIAIFILWLYVWPVMGFVLIAVEENEKPSILDAIGALCWPVTLPYILLKEFSKRGPTPVD